MNVSEAENLGTVGPDGGDYVTNITDRVNEGAGPGVGREEAVDGSNQTPASQPVPRPFLFKPLAMSAQFLQSGLTGMRG